MLNAVGTACRFNAPRDLTVSFGWPIRSRQVAVMYDVEAQSWVVSCTLRLVQKRCTRPTSENPGFDAYRLVLEIAGMIEVIGMQAGT